MLRQADYAFTIDAVDVYKYKKAGQIVRILLRCARLLTDLLLAYVYYVVLTYRSLYTLFRAILKISAVDMYPIMYNAIFVCLFLYHFE